MYMYEDEIDDKNYFDYCIPRTNVRTGGILWYSRRYAASAAASADISSFSR